MTHPFPKLSEERPQVGLCLLLGGTVQLPLDSSLHVVLSGVQLLGPDTEKKLHKEQICVTVPSSDHLPKADGNRGLSQHSKMSILGRKMN